MVGGFGRLRAVAFELFRSPAHWPASARSFALILFVPVVAASRARWDRAMRSQRHRSKQC